MLSTIEKTIADNSLIARGDIVLIGVSGGPDSIALFHCLYYMREKLNFDIAVCHLNHHIRGKESDKDARFVKDFMKQFSVPFFSGNANVMSRKRARGGSIEEIARIERYKFFRKIAWKCGANKIALGHTAGDNVETFLFNLLRGTGLKGLAGIPVKRAEGEFEIIRPLLDVSKEQILEYLKIEKLKYRTDTTNLDTSYSRNRIRLRLLPYLRKNYNPKINKVIRNTSRYLRQCSDYVQHEISRIDDSIVRRLDAGFSIPVPDYMRLHPAFCDLLLRKLLEDSFGINANDELLRHIRSLTEQKGKYRIIMPNNVIGCLEYDSLIFTRELIKKAVPGIYNIPIPSKTIVSEWNLAVETSIIRRKDLPGDFNVSRREPMRLIWRQIIERGEPVCITEYFDADLTKADSLTLRCRKPGDKYRPLGKGGTRTLKKLLIDEKVPITVRDRIPVFAASGRIIYVPGYRIADVLKIADKTISVLKVNMTIFPL